MEPTYLQILALDSLKQLCVKALLEEYHELVINSLFVD